MLTPRQKYEVCRVKSGTALIPIKNASVFNFYLSTRIGNIIVDKGDGISVNHTVSNKNKDFTSSFPLNDDNFILGGVSYSPDFTGNAKITFKNGLRDVYSIGTNRWNTLNGKLNITDIETFFAQFPNLYSLYINEFSSTAVIKGDLAKLPNSVERVLINYSDFTNAATDFVLNFSNYSNLSKLKYFRFDGKDLNPNSQLKVIGDLGKLPTSCNYLFLFKGSTGSYITYTAGKVWASSFDTLSIPLHLTTAELDSLLIDMDNSITTKIGAGVIALVGYRSSASDAAVASLVAKGFTLNVEYNIRLSMALSTNLLDTSPFLNHATMVGTANYTGGALNTSTGNYAYIPNKTSLDFGTGSLYFGCKVKFNSISGFRGIMGKSVYTSVVGRYSIYFDAGILNCSTQLTTGNNINSVSLTPYNDGLFHSIEVICNRYNGTQKLYIDGVLINTVSFTPSSDNLIRNARFMIGAFGNSTGSGLQANTELNGAIKDVFVHKF